MKHYKRSIGIIYPPQKLLTTFNILNFLEVVNKVPLTSSIFYNLTH